jgi:transcriptional regulator with XRE-family HTH domain
MLNVKNRWPSESELALVCGARIKALREQRALSQRELAELVQISKWRITKYELGRHTPPVHVLVRLAEVLRVPVDSLLGYAVQTPNLVRCLQEVELLDDEDRRVVIKTLDTIVTACRALLVNRPAGPPPETGLPR